MKVLVTGDRWWTNLDRTITILNKLPAGTIIVHGACRGADLMCAAAAATLGLSTRAYPADWNGFGQNRKAAGVVRNQKMLDCEHTEAEPIDICIAFHDNIAASRGTRDMLNRVIKANVPALLVTSCSKRFITEQLA